MKNPLFTFGAFLSPGGLRWYVWLWLFLIAFALVLRFTEWGRKVAKKIGDFNARAILTVIYVLILWPIGLLARIFSDPLQIKKRPSQWLDHPEERMDMQWAKRQ